MSELFLDEVIKGICIAIKDAQEAIDRYQVDQYGRCFAGGEGKDPDARAPATLTLPVPRGDGTYVAKEVPLVTLLHHDSLHLDEVRFKLAVRSSWDDEASRMKVDIGPLPSEAAATEDPRGKLHEIELVFKRGETSEGMARLKDAFVKTI